MASSPVLLIPLHNANVSHTSFSGLKHMIVLSIAMCYLYQDIATLGNIIILFFLCCIIKCACFESCTLFSKIATLVFEHLLC